MAKTHYYMLIKLYPDSIYSKEAKLKIAGMLFNEKEYDKACDIYKSLEESIDDRVAEIAVQEAAMCYFKNKKYFEADNEYKKYGKIYAKRNKKYYVNENIQNEINKNLLKSNSNSKINNKQVYNNKFK